MLGSFSLNSLPPDTTTVGCWLLETIGSILTLNACSLVEDELRLADGPILVDERVRLVATAAAAELADDVDEDGADEDVATCVGSAECDADRVVICAGLEFVLTKEALIEVLVEHNVDEDG